MSGHGQVNRKMFDIFVFEPNIPFKALNWDQCHTEWSQRYNASPASSRKGKISKGQGQGQVTKGHCREEVYKSHAIHVM